MNVAIDMWQLRLMRFLRHTCRKSMMAVSRCQSGHQQLDLFCSGLKMDESFDQRCLGEARVSGTRCDACLLS